MSEQVWGKVGVEIWHMTHKRSIPLDETTSEEGMATEKLPTKPWK